MRQNLRATAWLAALILAFTIAVSAFTKDRERLLKILERFVRLAQSKMSVTKRHEHGPFHLLVTNGAVVLQGFLELADRLPDGFS